MSKAIWCDRCNRACAEHNATHIETKWAFVTTHLDLCPKCAQELKVFLYGKKEANDDRS